MADKDTDLQFSFFDRFVPHYDDRRVEFMVDPISALPPGSRVLDVGCGDGSVVRYLAEKATHVDFHGCDPSPAYIERAGEAGGGAFTVGSVFDLPDELDGTFDSVVMVAVLHHLVGRSLSDSEQFTRDAMERMTRLVRPGGSIHIFEPAWGPSWLCDLAFLTKLASIKVLGNRRVELGKSWINLGAPLVRYYAPETLREFAADAGAVVERCELVDSRTFGLLLRREGIGLTLRVPGV